MEEISSQKFDKRAAIKCIVSLYQELWQIKENLVLPKLNHYFDNIKDDIQFIVEYPYVDKVYRDSFYLHFSAKHNTFDRNCIRISLFEPPISESYFRNKDKFNELQNKFRGFVVLRPIFPKIFGRAVINPDCLKIRNFEVCLANIDVLINGIKLSICGFPHSSQDGETIKCAETSIWCVMEYFGNKYPEYSTVLPSRIISTLKNLVYHRQTPSSGLTQVQISFALKEFGFGSKVYMRPKTITNDNINDLKRTLTYYIESGIPVIAHVESANINHALVFIGQQEFPNSDIEFPKSSNPNVLEVSDSADLNRKFIVIDDNYPPYQQVDFETPLQHWKNGKNAVIKGMIVPLYKNIHLEAVQAMKYSKNIIEDSLIGFKYLFYNKIFIRLLLTSSRSFKFIVNKSDTINEELKELFIKQTMPKFVWLAEITTIEHLGKGKAIGMILIDATAYNYDFRESILGIVYPDCYIFRQEKQFKKINMTVKPFKIYKNLNGEFLKCQH